MGKIIRSKYRVEMKDQTGWNLAVWRGRASDTRLAEYARGTDRSMQHDGVNAHVARALGFIPHVSEARIVSQYTGEVVATYRAPLFEVMQ